MDEGGAVTTAPALARTSSLPGWARAGLEVLLVLALWVLYSLARLLADTSMSPAVARAHELLQIEQAVGLHWEVTLNHLFVEYRLLGLLSSYWYASLHYVVTVGVLVWLWRLGADRYGPARRALVIATLIGLLCYITLPTAPPRFISGYVDVLALHSADGWWGADASAPRGVGGLTNELAAFPSLHAGWALWVALALHLYATRRWVRVLGWVYAVGTAVVIIGTGNHWVIDAVFGLSIAVGIARADWPEAAAALPDLEENGYVLVWADEFEADGAPNPANWDYEHGFVRNRELQWYQPQNARVEDGQLVIEARHERFENPEHRAEDKSWAARRRSVEVTSASLKTQGKHHWLYGRFVMRAKIPTAPGMWPAFWTLGDGPWPRCGEIDVMEFYRGKVLANACWRNDDDETTAWDTVQAPVDRLGDADWADRYHVWRMDWTSEKIDLSVDGRLINSIPTEAADGTGRDGANPFRMPHYLLVNLAVGGDNGGELTGASLPAEYRIDYIRVYQRSEQGSNSDSSVDLK